MKRRNLLKGLVAVPVVLAGCKAVTMPTDKIIKAEGEILEQIKKASEVMDAADIPAKA